VGACAGVLASIALFAAIVKAVGLAFEGLAGALAAWMGGREWAGQLLAGAAFLLLIVLAGGAAAAWLSHSSRRRSMERYAERQRRQRAAFGHDVSQRAASLQAKV
jgi:hypothetical protein